MPSGPGALLLAVPERACKMALMVLGWAGRLGLGVAFLVGPGGLRSERR